MSFSQMFDAYTNSLRLHRPEEITEHSLRPALQKLMEEIKPTVNGKILILHEPKRKQDYGAPDFKLTLNEGILGYVENKALGVNLDATLKSEQIQRYKKLSNNILLTNYLDWIWLREGKEQGRVSLCSLNELQQPRFRISEARTEQLAGLVQGFLSTATEGIGDPKKLAQALGRRGQLLKSYLLDELRRQEKDDAKGKLIGLYNIFKRMVDHELKLEDFTDTFAQMLVYGLFMARLNSGTMTIDLFNVEKYIPGSFELIHELVSFLKVLDQREYAETKWIVEEVLAVLNSMDMIEIVNSLSFDKRNRKADPETARDPYVYFYEDFLAAYDKALKKARGVYYTPPEVVNFIIRAVNEILKDTFQIEDGLADYRKVTLLDFACGTGTFLLEAIRQILDQTPPAKRDLIVKEHILKNLYGFEYMIAPYTVAHLKLTQYLKDRSYDLDPMERFKVYLTNTLEHFEVEDENLLPALSTESKQAKGVKDKPILVITGNPPYSYVSKNNGEWIKELVKDYFFFDGKPLDEKNPKALQDDYVKFIRFAQWKMEQVDEGIVAIITNHSYLDSPTLRGMRQSLIKTFNQMYFLDLHGNSTKKEKTPEGGKDENVFDIKQGVAISILIKTRRDSKMLFHDLYGMRKSKYEALSHYTIDNLVWNEVNNIHPEMVFNVRMIAGISYTNCPAVPSLFVVSNSGVKTHRDILVVDFNGIALVRKIFDFLTDDTSCSSFSKKYNLNENETKSLRKFKATLSSTQVDENKLIEYLYRPFDKRCIYYSNEYIDRSRKEIMSNFINDNVAILVGRQGIAVDQSVSWNLVFVTDSVTDTNIFYRGGGIVFPYKVLYDADFLGEVTSELLSNIAKEWVQWLKQKRKIDFENSSRMLFGYVYGVLHSPTYRTKYKDFLKTDFPRIPFCEDYEVFETLADLGWRLIDAHLMKSSEPRQKYHHLGIYQVPGDNVVDKVFYTDTLQSLNINERQYFAPVPPELYNFHIGGYQVLNKYLKDRKGRTLTLDEINNVESIVRIIAFTQGLMLEIDVLTKNWI